MDVYSLEHSREQALSAAVASLAAGGVVLVPTETVYGLMACYDNLPGRERIFALKHRPAEKQLQMLSADLPMAWRAGVEPDARLEALAARFFPGPLTVVCRSRTGTVGLRIPEHPFVLEMIRRLGFPLAATSANRSGEPAAAALAPALSGLAGEPDLAVDGGVLAGLASTVISLLEKEPVLLREGPIPWAAVLEALASA